MTTEDKALAIDLSDLARRVMDLQGPSREVDAEIAKAFGLAHGRKEIVHYESRSYTTIDEQALHYTASLDAAMTLVPPHTVAVSFDLEFGLDGETCGAILTIASLAGNQEVRAVAKTHFNAITAAALLARGEQSDANT